MEIPDIRKVTNEDKSRILSSCCGGPDTGAGKAPCCGLPANTGGGKIDETVPGFQEWLTTDAGKVPRITSEICLSDRVGAWKARWGIGRMTYTVPPGLYALGHPTPDDPVLVTANYKMSFDIIRKAMAGRNAWLLVLETFGINVWCAAGKGTFGTEELVRRIGATGLVKVVNHRRLLLPILGAPGVGAHEVARRSGFSVSYATIRANDLPEYLANGMVTSPAMRELTFTFLERLVLVPVELVLALKSTALIALCLFILGALLSGASAGIMASIAYLGATLAGTVLGPLLLPWLPGSSFSIKGAVVGLIWSATLYVLAGGSTWSTPVILATFLALPAVSAFYTLNFTGATTFTSRSGVRKEMRIAIPAMGSALAASILLVLAGRFL
jgi:acetyl-CoA decarbonylase/synthase complex subunit gamma